MKPRELWDAEPVALAEAIRSTLERGLLLLVLCGVPLTAEQLAGILAFAGALWTLLAIIVRNKVSPTGGVPLTKETIQ